jgi:hypothetical protein
MDQSSRSEREWSDAALKDAIAVATNWRDVMRALGLRDNSAGAIRIIKRHAARLGLDTSHFQGKRSCSDSQLRRAIIDAQSWDELLTTLGLAPRGGDGRIRVKAHAMRLGLDLAHLGNLRYLRDAATSVAASWFSLCGFNVAFPLEPALYDLLVSTPEGIKRVQVKTTTCFSKDGWTVVVGRRPYSIGNRERRVPYDPELIDWFFIMDGDLTIYLIPSRVIAGRITILLHTYTKYIVGSAAGFMTPRPGAA